MDTLFSMKDVFAILKKSSLWILSFAIGGVAIAIVAIYFFLTPLFSMNTQILVSQTSQNENAISQNAEVQANLQLVNTYRVLIKSPRVLSEVEKNMSEDYSVSELTKKIEVSTEQDSQVINITATDKNPDVAAEIANETAKAFQKVTPKVMKVDNINILAEAKPAADSTPVSPKPALIIIIGLLGGTLLGVLIAFMRNLLSNKFKEDKDVEKLGVPMLGSIGKLPIQKADYAKGRSKKHEK
ncbi:capsular biosynthesis protein [Listeria weihenstephanensis]|uniref:Capsular biosynthesis protein n=1 Tax=Listeria weihenstephanensis TaxID=1006155 RepID=A0A841Z3A4_9LIST|nr:Wzz/FepE/Etk N-terminal domain-containing protein [Listeria weihenstephanensis]MBC1499774.1 capsular biosynthesis protein [Listeria weihenstephanensis]